MKEHCSSCISNSDHSSLEKLYNCQILHRSFIIFLYCWLTDLFLLTLGTGLFEVILNSTLLVSKKYDLR